MAAEPRDSVQRLKRFAEANRFEQTIDREQALRQLKHHTMVIDDVSIRYIQHKLPDATRILAHLSFHGKSDVQFNEAFIDQLAAEFGFGPRAEWDSLLVDRPPVPSVQILKIIPA